MRISAVRGLAETTVAEGRHRQIGKVDIKQYHGADIGQHGAGITVRPTKSTGRATDAAFAPAIVRMCHTGMYKY